MIDLQLGNPPKAKPISTPLGKIVTRTSLKRSDVRAQQRTIFEFMLRNSKSINAPNFRSISSEDLGLLFHITDELFFGGHLAPESESSAVSPLRFRLSKRMTISGGMTTMTRNHKKDTDFEIAIATTPLFQSFQKEERIKVGGVPCENRLEALQRIMEHEMIHLAEMILWDDSNCQARRFKSISSRLFAHTESNHQLLTPRDIARSKMQIRIGDQVKFRANGRSLTGYVNRITKRATVLVEDPNGTPYTDGVSYRKFYVPLKQLKKAG